MSTIRQVAAVAAPEPADSYEEYLTVRVCGEWFGVPVGMIRDVLRPLPLTHVPMAPPHIAGLLNLRGRIVTAIDVRRCLALPDRTQMDRYISVVVDHEGHFYSLVVDEVGEVLALAASRLQGTATVDKSWRVFSRGVYELEDRLMVVLNVTKLLEIDR